MKIDKKQLTKIYLEKVNEITEALENKSYFFPEEIVGIISDIIENNPELVTMEKSDSFC